jgi:hypothetical protein
MEEPDLDTALASSALNHVDMGVARGLLRETQLIWLSARFGWIQAGVTQGQDEFLSNKA